MAFRISLQAATLAASILSCISTFGALFFIFTRQRIQKSLRHSLVINLLVAEFTNSCNNSISGIVSIANSKDLQPGPACTANGFIGQLSSQAIDFSVLSIAISILHMILRPSHNSRRSLTFMGLVCASVWLFGLTTSCIILGLQAFGPVSGNWCWIKREREDLRYALSHSWRLGVFLSVIAIYTYIAVHLGFRFSWLRQHTPSASRGLTVELRLISKANELPAACDPTTPVSSTNSKMQESRAPVLLAPDEGSITPVQNDKSPEQNLRREPSVITIQEHQVIGDDFDQHDTLNCRKNKQYRTPEWTAIQSPKPVVTNPYTRLVLLMTAYPIMYILLWIPGIANRIVEATGRTSLPLQYAQASTQLLGLIDSVIFGILYSRSRDS